MKRKTIGIAAICIGLSMMAYSGMNMPSVQKVDAANLVSEKTEKSYRMHWPPFISVLLLVGGITILITDRKN